MRPAVPDTAVLVALETEGNQRYIFATNRLRENVGGSERIHRLGAVVARSIAEADPGAGLLAGDEVDRERLLGIRPLGPGVPYEVVTAGSGQALVLADGVAGGERLVRTVIGRFLRDAPGLTVRGAVVGIGGRSMGECVADAVGLRAAAAARMPAAELRFQRLPFAADCRYSGLPAYRVDPRAEGGAGAEVSKVSGARSADAVIDHALARTRRLLGASRGLVPENATDLDALTRQPDEAAWLAVVHADGNGLGQVFTEFERLSGTQGDRRAWVDALRRFSVGIDLFTEAAFVAAVEALPAPDVPTTLPLLPLILGGDDLTVMLDGRHALQFTVTFLKRLEDGPAVSSGRGGEAVSEVRRILAEAREQMGEDRYSGKFSACAGVAVVKPHFPFHVAYHLAEQILKSAKRRKPESALDFHVLHDTTGVDLDDLRYRLLRHAAPGIHLTAGPRTLDELGQFASRLDLVRDRTSPRAIPRTVLAELRQAARLGRQEADRRLALVRKRAADTHLSDLYSETVFQQTGDGEVVTDLLDLLEAAGVWSVD